MLGGLVAAIIFLVMLFFFPDEVAAQEPIAKKDANCNMSLSRERARISYPSLNDSQEVAVFGDYGVYYRGKKKPAVRVVADTALSIKYDLPADSGYWLTVRRWFAGIKDLASCGGVKFNWKVEAPGEACLRFVICDLNKREDFSGKKTDRTWNYDFDTYILGNSAGGWNESKIPFYELKKDSSYGGRPAPDSGIFNPGLIAAFEICVYVPIETGRETTGKFYIKDVRTFKQ